MGEARGIAEMECLATAKLESKAGGPIGPYPEASDGRQTLLIAGCAARLAIDIMGVTAAALVACSTASHAQAEAIAPQTAPTAQEQPAPVADSAPASDGLSDLNAMTFGCVKAGLNAAAREAAKTPSQGTYQFSYFKIIDDSHNSSYEVHFKSNYEEEPDLRYCVSIYCQQGWDPKSTETLVRLMSDEHQPMGVAAHEADCGDQHAPAKYRLEP
jgi:hypothetical protein